MQRSAEMDLGIAQLWHPHRAGIDREIVVAVARQVVGIGAEYPALQQQRLALVLRRQADAALEAEGLGEGRAFHRSEEHTSELPSLMRISYAVLCLNKKNS